MRKRILLACLLTLTGVCSSAQIVFEKGYFIDEADKRIECLIKNVDWKDNPTEFQYKISEASEIRSAAIQQVKEFAILGASRYVRARVKIDRSSDEVEKMSLDRNPVFEDDVLFLLVLIDGKATLYAYQQGNTIRFFFKTSETEIQQLIYKRYRTAEGQIGQNNTFKQQILMNLKCQDITANDAEKVGYNKSSMENMFVKYNKCSNPTYVNSEKKEKRDLFNFTVRLGLNVSSLSVTEASSFSKSVDFGTKFNPRFGLEAEFIMPFNKNKWAITLEPTYQYFKAEETMEAPFIIGGVLVANVEYQSVELPVMLRYYFFLKNESKLYLNTGFVMDSPINSTLVYTRADGSELSSMEIDSQLNWAFGVGYKFKKKFSVETRYLTGREILNKYTFWTSKYPTASFIIGYTF